MPKYTLVKTINADGKSPLFYFEGPSDATEPTDDWITDNSELLQKDTGVRKFKKGNTWEPIASSDGSGGEFYDTSFTTNDGVTFEASNSISSIIAASAANKLCRAKIYADGNHYMFGSISSVSLESTSEVAMFSFLTYLNGKLQFQALFGVRSRESESDEWSQDSWRRASGDVLPDYADFQAGRILVLTTDSEDSTKPAWVTPA